MDASVGGTCKMDRAYIDESTGQAICCWSAPDKQSVEELFQRANVKPVSITQVTIYSG